MFLYRRVIRFIFRTLSWVCHSFHNLQWHFIFNYEILTLYKTLYTYFLFTSPPSSYLKSYVTLVLDAYCPLGPVACVPSWMYVHSAFFASVLPLHLLFQLPVFVHALSPNSKSYYCLRDVFPDSFRENKLLFSSTLEVKNFLVLLLFIYLFIWCSSVFLYYQKLAWSFII